MSSAYPWPLCVLDPTEMDGCTRTWTSVTSPSWEPLSCVRSSTTKRLVTGTTSQSAEILLPELNTIASLTGPQSALSERFPTTRRTLLSKREMVIHGLWQRDACLRSMPRSWWTRSCGQGAWKCLPKLRYSNPAWTEILKFLPIGWESGSQSWAMMLPRQFQGQESPH